MDWSFLSKGLLLSFVGLIGAVMGMIAILHPGRFQRPKLWKRGATEDDFNRFGIRDRAAIFTAFSCHLLWSVLPEVWTVLRHG